MSHVAHSPRLSWQSFLKQLFSRRRRPIRGKRSLQDARLSLEHLDDRIAPAVYIADNPGPPTQNAESGSLYDAVALADGDHQPCTVIIPVGTGGYFPIDFGDVDVSGSNGVTIDGGTPQLNLVSGADGGEFHILPGADVTFRNIDFGTLSNAIVNNGSKSIVNEGQTTFENCTFEGGDSTIGGVIHNTAVRP
jgi:hypothetical protein